MKQIKKMIWILKNGKSILLFLIASTIISSSLSLVGVYNAFISKSLIDSAINLDLISAKKWLLIMGLIMFSRIFINFFLSFITKHVTIKFNQNLQKQLYKHITFSKIKDQTKISSMNIITRIQSDVSTISSMLLDTVPSLISLIITFSVSLSALLYLSPTIALVGILIGPFLVLISRFFSMKLKKIYKDIQETDVEYKNFIQETICNSAIVKAFCLENQNIKNLNIFQERQYKLAMDNTKLSLSSGLIVNIATSTAYFAIFFFSAINIAKGISTYGTMTAMLQLYNNIKSPFQSLASIFPSLISSISAVERLIEIEKMDLENLDSYNLETCTQTKSYMKHPSIEFNNIEFSYNEKNTILNSINFKVNPGEIIALVGSSGEGKTTIIKLLLSFIEKNKGNISLIDNSYKEFLSPNHRKIISYVPQGNTLFTGTILSNILLGNPDATNDEIISATKQAAAYDFISSLKDGLYTKIGENGSGVSEGQAQRICIARALIKKKPILILDEATSSLDEKTEIEIIKSIQHLDYKPTCIIITHRPYALTICDKIFKLETGKIKEFKTNK